MLFLVMLLTACQPDTKTASDEVLASPEFKNTVAVAVAEKLTEAEVVAAGAEVDEVDNVDLDRTRLSKVSQPNSAADTSAYIEIDPSDTPPNACVNAEPLRLWKPVDPKPGDFTIRPQKSFGPLKSDETQPERVLPRLGWVFQSNTIYSWSPPSYFESTQAALQYMKDVWMVQCSGGNLVKGSPGNWMVFSYDKRLKVKGSAIKIGQDFSQVRQRNPGKPVIFGAGIHGSLIQLGAGVTVDGNDKVVMMYIAL